MLKRISNVSGDYGSPTTFYAKPIDTLIYFSTGDFGTLIN